MKIGASSGFLLVAGLAVAGLVGFWQLSHGQDRDPLTKRFRQLDRNRDGKVTPAELPQPRLFNRLDRNGDDAITLEEARAAIAAGALNDPAPPTSNVPSNKETAQGNPSKVPPAIRQGPKLLKPGEHGIGRRIPDHAFTDITSNRYRLSDFTAKHRAVVVALTGTGCPLCLRYAPALATIEKAYRDRDVGFLYVNPNESEKLEAIQASIQSHGFHSPYVQDAKMEIPRLLGAQTTTEVFILDAAQTLVYRGAVDDQYGLAYAHDAPRQRFLINALDAVLADQAPPVAATSSPGCELFYPDRSKKQVASKLTFHNRISRIIQANCVECHRDGGIAPMALERYDQVKDYAGMIRNVVERGVMPPWFASPLLAKEGSSGGVSHWANDRSLADVDRKDLFAWIEAGAPEGNPKNAPLPRKFPDGWLIGKPDAVFGFDRPVKVKATGTMPYKNIVVETDLPEDKWVQAIEVRPGNPSVVHHVLVFVQGDKNGRVSERSGYWGVYVPGNSTLIYPEGYAKRLPKGARLRFQMHYTPNGTPTQDRTRIGLVFAKKPPRHEVKVTGIANSRISIPPGADRHPEMASLRLPYDVQVLGFLPHMHLRGTAARYEVLTEKGAQTLLDIPRYDFNWQLLYRLAEPLRLQAGDTLRFTAWYDNSTDNPANPDPNRRVRWGPQTFDEMHLGYVEYIVPGVKPGESVQAIRGDRGAGRFGSGGLFRRLDGNGDGWVTREEVRERLPNNPNALRIFTQLDRDGNDKLDQDELAKLERLRR